MSAGEHHDPLRPTWVGIAQDWLRRDGLAILLYLVATVIMTYPLAFKMNGQWLAFGDIDTYVKLWDKWWLANRLFAGEPMFYTTDQFYPIGVDLAYHSISWTVTLGWWLMGLVFNNIVAYNLTIFIAIFSTGYAAYLLINTLVERRTAAWLGGLVYTFAPYHIAHTAGHPDLVHLAPIPLAVLLLGYALSRRKPWPALAAALMIGIAALTSLYIMVFALLTVLAVFAWTVVDRANWRDKRYWFIILVFGIGCVIFLAPRLAPVFRNPEALTSAIDAKYTADEDQTDLLAFIVPSQDNPLFGPYVEPITNQFLMNKKWPAYLGLVPLALTGVAVTWQKRRRQILPWFLAALLFMVLSLGPVLRFNGQVHESIPLPAAALSWFPPIRAVGRPDYFVLGMLLPLGVCAAFGLDRLLAALGDNRIARAGLMLGLTVLLLFEFWNGPYPVISAGVNPFYERLAQEDGDFAVINLPIGRKPAKVYVYEQTIHNRPIVEGIIARTPDDAYDYINSNYLLSLWRRRQPLSCSSQSAEEIQLALDQLVSDGFRYVIIHNRDKAWELFSSYFPVEAVHEDGELRVYRLSDVQDNPPCSPAGST
ncbi:MAG: hypothetical protein PVH65_04745 [Chloroflexota bacterium]|jgi:hypothetical protein